MLNEILPSEKRNTYNTDTETERKTVKNDFPLLHVLMKLFSIKFFYFVFPFSFCKQLFRREKWLSRFYSIVLLFSNFQVFPGRGSHVLPFPLSYLTNYRFGDGHSWGTAHSTAASGFFILLFMFFSSRRKLNK